MHRQLLTVALVAGLVSACQGQSTSAPMQSADTSTPPPAAPTTDPVNRDEVASAPARDDNGAPAAGTVVLQRGMSADIGERSTLTFEKIISDSRCAAGVQCIWAGEVTVSFKLVAGSAQESFQLSTHTAPRHETKGYAVELLGYDRCPAGGPAVTPLSGECATLRAVPAK